MKEGNVVTLRQPGEFADPLTGVLRSGARSLLAHAAEAEVAALLAAQSARRAPPRQNLRNR
jgi:putative transposase